MSVVAFSPKPCSGVPIDRPANTCYYPTCDSKRFWYKYSYGSSSWREE